MSSDLEHLLAHSGWIRGLARHLARDGQTADDLVQDAWVVALRDGPTQGASLRSWVAGVVRNLARQGRRRDARRLAREQRAARPEATTSHGPADGLPDALVERLDEQEALAAAVRALDEPYRAAILLRYYEGLSPNEIAARTGTPLRTVHTRLNRALHRLRAKLGAEPGGRTWSILALPWIGVVRNGARGTAASTASAVSLGGLLVKTNLWIAAGCAALVGAVALGTWWIERPTQSAPALAAAPRTAQLVAPPATELDESAANEAAERSAIVVPEVAALEPAPSSEAPELPPTSGLVIDARGAAVAGVNVAFTGSRDARRAIATSDGQGHFAFEESLPTGELTAASAGWTTVLKPELWTTNRSETPVLVVAPSRELAGVVVDAAGAPIAGAVVELELPHDLRGGLPAALEYSSAEHWRVTSDAHGRFALAAAPDVARASLSGKKAGHRSASREAPAGSAYDLELVLEPGDDARLLRGTVIDAAGEPVSGAHVGLGWSGTRTDERGLFAIELPGPVAAEDGVYRTPDRLWVVAKGSMPASVQRRGPLDTLEAWPDPLRIVLDGVPLSITGRVLDEDGAPLAGIWVSTEDTATFGAVHDEDGGTSLDVAVEWLVTGNVSPVFDVTDASGVFELGGLLARDYRLSARDADTLIFTRTGPIAAGSRGVVVHLPAADDVPLVAGRVVGLDGTPLPDATVIPQRDWVLPDGTRRIEGNQGHRTDAHGRFAIHGLKAAPDRIQVRGSSVLMSATWDVPAGADLTQLEVAVARRCRFKVELDEPGTATRFEVLDAEGQALELVSFRGDHGLSMDTWSLAGGHSELLSVSEHARTLVLHGPEGEVRRSSLDLDPDELVTVR